jgi:hypothetical protein
MAKREKFLKDPAQYVQLDSLIKEGKTCREILAFFKATYGIDMPKWVMYDRKHRTTKKAGISITRKKRASKTVSESFVEKGASPDELTEAIQQLESELKMFCLRIRMVARREILKYIARIRKARLASGENIPEEENKRLYQELESLKISKEEVKEVNF